MCEVFNFYPKETQIQLEVFFNHGLISISKFFLSPNVPIFTEKMKTIFFFSHYSGIFFVVNQSLAKKM